MSATAPRMCRTRDSLPGDLVPSRPGSFIRWSARASPPLLLQPITRGALPRRPCRPATRPDDRAALVATQQSPSIAVLGAGSRGTALAVQLARANGEVTLA